ncbi:MAG: hypothetical protein QOE92_83 [Chloroflexota bacterium]|nr:hypothetical protein [Chloroflexota bacterium]
MSAAADGFDAGIDGWRRPSRYAPLELLALGLVLVVAALLRFHDYTLAPTLFDNQDPLQFGWAGLTLITKHSPYAWEIFKVYKYDYILSANGSQYAITHPWLSHPPLFSILVGGWAYLSGARELTDVTPAMMRPVAIILSLVSMALGYVLARRVIGTGAALLALVLLAVSPGAVLLGREVETEALMAPLFLAALLMIHRLHTGEGGRIAMAVLLACCVLLPLTKVTGVVVAGALGVTLLAGGRWRLAIATVLAGAAGFGLFAAYGALFDFQLWLAVLAEWRDVHRHGVMAGLEFIVDSAGVGRAFRDGWWQLGWIALGAMMLRGRRGPGALLLAWPVVAYAAGMALLGDVLVQGRFGWYRIVLYPVVYAAVGAFALAAIRRPSLPALLLVLVLGGATATVMVPGRLWEPNPYVLAGVIGAALLPAAIMAWRHESTLWPRIAQGTAAALIAVVLLSAAVESWNLASIYTQI